MTTQSIYNLRDLNLLEYFDKVKEIFFTNQELEFLTKLLSDGNFTETKPYLIRRKLEPKDKRFKTIELVYENPNKVTAIFWDIDIKLSYLISFFGTPRFHYSPHGGVTMIGFFSNGNKIFTGFESNYPGNVSEINNGYRIISDENVELIQTDLDLTYVSLKTFEVKNPIKTDEKPWWKFWK